MLHWNFDYFLPQLTRLAPPLVSLPHTRLKPQKKKESERRAGRGWWGGGETKSTSCRIMKGDKSDTLYSILLSRGRDRVGPWSNEAGTGAGEECAGEGAESRPRPRAAVVRPQCVRVWVCVCAASMSQAVRSYRLILIRATSDRSRCGPVLATSPSTSPPLLLAPSCLPTLFRFAFFNLTRRLRRLGAFFCLLAIACRSRHS